MKRIMLAALLAGVSLASAEDISTTTGQTYKNASIIRADAIRVTIKHAYGIAQVPIVTLPAEWQQRLGYNRQAAASPPTETTKAANLPVIPQHHPQAAAPPPTETLARPSNQVPATSPPESQGDSDSGKLGVVCGVFAIVVLISWLLLGRRSYLLCIICPPLAVLLVGRPFAALLNVALTCFYWIPGVLHALLVVGGRKTRRHRKAGRAVAPEKTSWWGGASRRSREIDPISAQKEVTAIALRAMWPLPDKPEALAAVIDLVQRPSRSGIRLELYQILEAANYAPAPDVADTVGDLFSEEGANLFLQTASDMGFGYMHYMQDTGCLIGSPCWELKRAQEEQEPCDWRARWVAAGGRLFNQRMIARKNDPIWVAISEFGLPYDPLAFNTGYRRFDVSYTECVKLRVIKRDEEVSPPPPLDLRTIERNLRAAYQRFTGLK